MHRFNMEMYTYQRTCKRGETAFSSLTKILTYIGYICFYNGLDTGFIRNTHDLPISDLRRTCLIMFKVKYSYNPYLAFENSLTILMYAYANFTTNSIFRPEAIVKNKICTPKLTT